MKQAAPPRKPSPPCQITLRQLHCIRTFTGFHTQKEPQEEHLLRLEKQNPLPFCLFYVWSITV